MRPILGLTIGSPAAPGVALLVAAFREITAFREANAFERQIFVERVFIARWLDDLLVVFSLQTFNLIRNMLFKICGPHFYGATMLLKPQDVSEAFGFRVETDEGWLSLRSRLTFLDLSENGNRGWTTIHGGQQCVNSRVALSICYGHLLRVLDYSNMSQTHVESMIMRTSFELLKAWYDPRLVKRCMKRLGTSTSFDVKGPLEALSLSIPQREVWMSAFDSHEKIRRAVADASLKLGRLKMGFE